MIHQETISEDMYALSQVLIPFLGEDWYLAGGTALALRLGHRKSVDLDFFSSEPVLLEELKTGLTTIVGDRDWRVTYEAPGTLWVEVSGVKISFIERKSSLVQPVENDDTFRLASLSDITVMKLLAICSREEYKDYFDLACLMKATDVRQWLSWWEEVYPTQDPTSWLVALGAVDTVESIPLMIMDEFKGVDVVSEIPVAVREIQKQLLSH